MNHIDSYRSVGLCVVSLYSFWVFALGENELQLHSHHIRLMLQQGPGRGGRGRGHLGGKIKVIGKITGGKIIGKRGGKIMGKRGGKIMGKRRGKIMGKRGGKIMGKRGGKIIGELAGGKITKGKTNGIAIKTSGMPWRRDIKIHINMNLTQTQW